MFWTISLQLDSLIWETASPRTHKPKIVNESLSGDLIKRLLTRNCGPHSCDIYRQICCFEISSQSENTATSESTVDYTDKTSIFTKKIWNYRRTSMARTLMAHSPCLARTITIVPTGHFMHIKYTLDGWNYPSLELFLVVPSLFEPLKYYCICSFRVKSTT